MPLEHIQPSGLSQPAGSTGQPAYTHVVKAGNTVYIAGQVSRNAAGEIVGQGDIDAQVAQVLENLTTAMASVGGTLQDLVQIRIYLTDARYRDNWRAINPRYLNGKVPASTLLIVAALASPEYMIEVDAVGYVE